MNSDLMPSSESSKSTASTEAENSQIVSADANKVEQASGLENSPESNSENNSDDNLVNRMHPIPPPSEPMQYRAIGLVRGRYIASSEQFTQGALLTTDGVELDAVLLGRIMSLVKNHIDLEQEHLWVVYPRTRQENDKLHIQIVGIWEPENLAKTTSDEESDSNITEQKIPENDSSQNLTPSSEMPDSGFSVRGEVVYQSSEASNLVIKIRQAARKPNDKPKYFKLKLMGKIDSRAVGKFWDMQVKREGDSLAIEQAEFIADLPKKRRPPFKGGGGKKPFRKGGSAKPFQRRIGEAPPRPMKRTDDTQAASRPAPNLNRPTPKPVKRPKPPQE